MDLDLVVIVVAATLFAAAYLQSATGFGGAILCMAILPLVLSVRDAVNFVTMASLAVTLMIVFANRSGLSLKNAGPLCLGMMLGIPIGYYSLRQLDDTFVVRVLALIVVELGLITPPVGLNVYIISALSDGVPMSETFKGVLPFLGAEAIRVSLILLVPGLALLVPHWLAG